MDPSSFSGVFLLFLLSFPNVLWFSGPDLFLTSPGVDTVGLALPATLSSVPNVQAWTVLGGLCSAVDRSKVVGLH